MAKTPELSLVVPLLNEEEALPALHAALARLADGLRVDAEFLFVDDGSTDRSLEVLRRLKRADARVRVVSLSRNFGKEAALSCGLDHARGRAVVPLDADLQDPPELVGPMLDLWRQGHDVVNARRADRRSDGPLKRWTARLFYRWVNRMSVIPLPEDVGDFRLLDRKVVDALKRLPERQRFMKGLFAWVGFKTATVTYARPPRAAGATKFNGWRLWNLALEGITSFSTVPLRVWSYFGLAVSFFAFAYGFYLLVRTLLTGNDVPGYASIFLAVIFFGGLQLLSVGLLGEYLGRIFMEAKQRPLYLVREEF